MNDGLKKKLYIEGSVCGMRFFWLFILYLKIECNVICQWIQYVYSLSDVMIV